jgi:glyoxylase-like metal-dependent hydrolase (beta-lactamase superfamily II)
MNFKPSNKNKQVYSVINDNIILIYQDSMDSMNFNSCNSYLVKINDKDYAIIDPGCSRRKLITTLKENNINFSNLKYYYLTHAHSDHVALIDFLYEKNKNIEGFIHQEDKKYIENSKAYYNMLFNLPLIEGKKKYEDFVNAIKYYTTRDSNLTIKQCFKPIFEMWNIKDRKIDQTFKQGDNLPGDLYVIHAPGHTPGMCMFFRKQDKILFSSDIHLSEIGAIVNGNAGNVHALKNSINKAIEMVENESVKTVLSGHGKNPITENLKERFIKFLGTITNKENQLLNLFQSKNRMTLEEITTETFKKFIKRFEKYLNNQDFKDTIVIAEATEMTYDLNILTELERLKRIKKMLYENELHWASI